MPILAAIGSALIALAIWYFRFRGPDGIGDLFSAANDARLAAKRFGYKMGRNKTAIQSIDDARLSATGVLVCVAKEEGSLTRTQELAIAKECKRTFNATEKDAGEMIAFARWVVDQEDSHRTWEKLLKRTVELGGQDVVRDLMDMAIAVTKAGTAPHNQTSEDVLSELKRLQRIG